MGRVYLGEQSMGETTRPVAVKVLAATGGNDEYIIARFKREAAMISSLRHPNIIHVYDHGEENGLFVTVMEYVSGGSLADKLSHGGVSPFLAEIYAWQIARALDEAHRHGIFHRDLKPENVLLAPSANPDEAETLKVVDFGIAHRPSAPGERALTNVGTVLGTPAYMAPEQLRGEPVDGRADVYALALVTYQLLSGVLPWPAHSLGDWTDAHLNRPPAPLATQPGCATLPPRYDHALAHALEKNPSQRTPSTLDFVRELSGGDAPNTESPPPPPPLPVSLSETLALDGPVLPMLAAQPNAGYAPASLAPLPADLAAPQASPTSQTSWRPRYGRIVVFSLIGLASVAAGFFAVWSALSTRRIGSAGAENHHEPQARPTAQPSPAQPVINGAAPRLPLPSLQPIGPVPSHEDLEAQRDAIARQAQQTRAKTFAAAGLGQLRRGELRLAIRSLRRANEACPTSTCTAPAETRRLRDHLTTAGDQSISQALRDHGAAACNSTHALVRELESVDAGTTARRTWQRKCPSRQ